MRIQFEIGWCQCRLLSRIERKIPRVECKMRSVKLWSHHPPQKKFPPSVPVLQVDIYFQISLIKSLVWSHLWPWALDCVVVMFVTSECRPLTFHSRPLTFHSRPLRFYSQPWDLLWNLDILLSTLHKSQNLFRNNPNSLWRREISQPIKRISPSSVFVKHRIIV